MNPTSVIALFCESVREEKNGMLSLVGILSDNVGLPSRPADAPETVRAMLPPMSVYVRINFDVEAELGPIEFSVTTPDGQRLPAGGVDAATIEYARATRDNGNPIGGIVSVFQTGLTAIPNDGRFTVEVKIGDQSYIAGFLNVTNSGSHSAK